MRSLRPARSITTHVDSGTDRGVDARTSQALVAIALSTTWIFAGACGRIGYVPVTPHSDAARSDVDALSDVETRDQPVVDVVTLDIATDTGPDYTLTSIAPTASMTGSTWSTPVSIHGTGFRAGLIASIGGSDCAMTMFVGPTELRCTRVDALPVGVVDVDVRSASTTQRLPRAFTSLGQPVVWLRADSITLTDGAPIPRWDDLSGHGNHALQTTANRQPSFHAAAVGGQPAVQFGDGDGASDFLNMTDSASLRPAAVTLVAVAEMTRATAFAKIVSRTYRSDGTHDTPYQSYSIGMSQDMTGLPYVDLTTAGTITSAVNDRAALATGFGTVMGSYDGTTIASFYRGTATGSNNNRTTSGPIDYTAMTVDVAIGSRSRYVPAEPLIGSIAEIFMYDHALPAAERVALSGYLDARYGL